MHSRSVCTRHSGPVRSERGKGASRSIASDEQSGRLALQRVQGLEVRVDKQHCALQVGMCIKMLSDLPPQITVGSNWVTILLSVPADDHALVVSR
eukprot:2505156-Pyramimonas_sp.AAC.1